MDECPKLLMISGLSIIALLGPVPFAQVALVRQAGVVFASTHLSTVFGASNSYETPSLSVKR